MLRVRYHIYASGAELGAEVGKARAKVGIELLSWNTKSRQPGNSQLR